MVLFSFLGCDDNGVIWFVLRMVHIFAPWGAFFYCVLAFIGVMDFLVFSLVLFYLFWRKRTGIDCDSDGHISFVYDYQ
ncbi:uncharacterized protein ASPGLDRAFT_234367 [Aspergillus glaucus CBS 516.65]|uniref:Uncharacterized protein n=1 Tax=Aspergillus glaucus CBS 516.65 TaxID=1160497 RepID=A0A1L9VZQ3_ASPGL|nr:hypothetical protein ASPGLDRAFT_234367 [Aspergillus glaucus CBS 516.65]OJJ89391.1 hypothetical protein ASPGLDRAFT_234367 [Aspergillus glaucus CBS 516.65]